MAGENDLADFTPAFLWLLRDFYLTLEEEGHKVSTLIAPLCCILTMLQSPSCHL